MDEQNLADATVITPSADNAPSDLNATPDAVGNVEKFTAGDLQALRGDLLQSGVDSFQAAEIVSGFLTDRGYGCSSQEARTIASRIEVPGATSEHIQAELERVARVM